MITKSTLEELAAQGKTGKALVSALSELVQPRDFSQNYDPDPEKHRVVGRVSERTARLCEVTRQVAQIRKMDLTQDEDKLVAEASIKVATARERSLKEDCRDAQPKVRRQDLLLVRKDGIIVTRKS